MINLEDYIQSVGRPHANENSGFSKEEAGFFMLGLIKMSAGEIPADPVELESEEAAAPEQMAPVATGPFAAAPEQVAETLRLIAAHELYSNAAYTVFAASATGPYRDALAEVFEDVAEHELADAKWTIEKIVVISGSAQLPPIPPPPMLADPEQMLDSAIQSELRAISLLRTLHAQVGEHPMKYTIEEKMADEQGHHDRFTQMKAVAKPEPAPKDTSAAKLAAAFAKVAGMPMPSAQAYIANERKMVQSQAENEAAFLRQHTAQVQTAAANSAAQAEAAQAEAASAQEQLSAMQQEQQVQAQQMAETQQMTQQVSQQAAEEANAKMRLVLRINQVRQQLADIASQDPTSEEGVMPEPGMEQPQTDNQQGAEAEAAAAQGAPGGGEAAEEAQEAERAKSEAAQQTQQAEAAQAKVASILAKYASGPACDYSAKLKALEARRAGRDKSAGLVDRVGAAIDSIEGSKAFKAAVGVSGAIGAAGLAHHLYKKRREKQAGITMAAPEAVHAYRISSMADHARKLKIDPKRVAALEAHHSNFTPKALPNWQNRAAPVAQAASPAVKRTPTVAHQPLALSKHLAQTNPKAAVHAGAQHGLPVTANASTLAELERMDHFKGAALQLAQKVAAAIKGPGGEPKRAPRSAVGNLGAAVEKKTPTPPVKPKGEGFISRKIREVATTAGEGFAEGAATNAGKHMTPENLSYVGRHAAEGAGHTFGQGMNDAFHKGDVLKRYDDAVKAVKKTGRAGAALGAGGLALFGAHKGLQHVSRARHQRQTQQDLNQRERMLRIMENRGQAA